MRNNTDPFRHPQKIIPEYLKRFLQERKDVLHPSDDVEPVHRMRVASRRLRAALSVFQSILPKKKIKCWKKEIRRIGRALGKARELDMHILFLQAAARKLKKDSCAADTEKIIQSLNHSRRKAQKKIEKLLKGFEVKKRLPGLRKSLDRLSSRAQRQLTHTFSSQRNEFIQKRLDRLLQFEPYVSKPESIHELHKMRIAAKNLRYALEILRPWYGRSAEHYIRSCRAIQDVLGDVHELDVLTEVLCGFFDPSQKEENRTLASLLQECSRARHNAYTKFVRLWGDLRRKRVWEALRKET